MGFHFRYPLAYQGGGGVLVFSVVFRAMGGCGGGAGGWVDGWMETGCLNPLDNFSSDIRLKSGMGP
jgi:hypothetical protein